MAASPMTQMVIAAACVRGAGRSVRRFQLLSCNEQRSAHPDFGNGNAEPVASR
jgi:hypothetical protein